MARLLAFIAAGLFAIGPAFAHTGVEETAGFTHGFAHPIGGLDHLLAMLAVGMLAAVLGGRALWLVPLSFILMMLAGGALGTASVSLPLVELGIGVSVIALGLGVGFRVTLPTSWAIALVGLFAIFHGHTHGAEMPETTSGVEYAAGFVLATALLHVCGITFGVLADGYSRRIGQTAGVVITIVGLAMLPSAMP